MLTDISDIRLKLKLTRVDRGSIPGRFIPKPPNMVLGDDLFNTQHYKVMIKGKVE